MKCLYKKFKKCNDKRGFGRFSDYMKFSGFLTKLLKVLWEYLLENRSATATSWLINTIPIKILTE